MTKSASALQSKLAKSLDKANTSQSKRKPPAPPKQTGERHCKKLSISLFDGDLERLDAIRDYMQTKGERISTSQAVKLALRTAPLTSALDKALEAIKAEDGRGKW